MTTDASQAGAALDELLALTDTDPAALAQFCDRHCPACQATAHKGEATQRAQCLDRGCRLRDPVLLLAERRWLADITRLAYPGEVTEERLCRLNEHLAAHRCAYAALARYPDGTLALGYETDGSLHGLIDLAALGRVAGLAGDTVHANTRSLTGKAGRALILERRRIDASIQRRHALRYLREGRPINWIAERLGIDRTTVRAWRDDAKRAGEL